MVTFAIQHPADVTATLVERCPSAQPLPLHLENQTAAVQTWMVGDHHIQNCLAAAAVGLMYGIDLQTVARGLESVTSVPGRLERIECGQPFGVYVDYAHTSDALSTVLATLRGVTRGRLICVFGAGGDRDREKRPAMGRVVGEFADEVIITSDNPRFEDPRVIAEQCLAGMQDPTRANVVLDRRQAIQIAMGCATEGDTVLIAGKGHESHQQIGRRRLPFCDRQVAREWLYRLAAEKLTAQVQW